ncbi:MAG: hypothetical protein SVT56_05610 [Chloroflexota bacterium]|nr:hypothetical protein [Chloroflexota bacterium]
MLYPIKLRGLSGVKFYSITALRSRGSVPLRLRTRPLTHVQVAQEQLLPSADSQLAVDAADVGLDRVQRDEQLLRHLGQPCH